MAGPILQPFTPKLGADLQEDQPLDMQPFTPKLGGVAEGKLDIQPFTPAVGDREIAPSESEESSPLTPDRDSDIIGSIGRGVQMSLAPITVDEKEFSEKRTKGERIAEGTANIITDIASTIAVSAGAGAVAGSVVPGAGTAVGTAAGVGLGIYRALGYEELMSRVEKRPFSPVKAAVNVSVEVIPALKLGGKVAKGVGMGVMSTIQGLQYGADLGTAATLGVIGGGLTAATTKATNKQRAEAIAALASDSSDTPKTIQWMVDTLEDGEHSHRLLDKARQMVKIDEKEIEAFNRIGQEVDLFTTLSNKAEADSFFDTINPEDFNLHKKLIKHYKRFAKVDATAAAKLAARARVETEVHAVARGVLNLPADARIGTKELQRAAQEIKSTGLTWEMAYNSSKLSQYLRKAVATINSEELDAGRAVWKTGKDGVLELQGQEGMFAKNAALNWFADPMFVAREIDRITGLNFEGTTNAITVAHNYHSKAQAVLLRRWEGLHKTAKKQGIIKDLADYLDGTKDIGSLQPEQMHVVNEVREIFDDIYAYGKKHNIDIDYMADYFPSQKMDTADAVRAFKKRAEELGEKAWGGSKDAFEFRSALSQASGIEVRGSADFHKALGAIESSGRLKSSTGYKASAAFQRQERIPMWLQERDVGRVLMRYTSSVTKAVHMTPVIKALETQIPALEMLGMKKSAEYYRRFVARVSGQPSDAMAYLNSKTSQLKIKLDKIIDDPNASKSMKFSAESAKMMPDFMSWLGAQIYANYLGFSPKAFIRNLTQSRFMTAPEIGGKYGHKLVTKATLGTAKDGFKLTNMEKYLQDLGYAPGKYVGEGMDIVTNSLRNSKIGFFVAPIEKVAELSLKAYGQTDVIGRYVTVKVSKAMFQDIREALAKGGQALSKDEQAAVKYIKSLNPGVKGEFKRLLQDARFADAERLLTEYLLSKTQLNYGPQALHKMGQEFGRLFSMFSKWPSVIVGDTAEMMLTGKKLEWAVKYGGPLLLLAGIQQWLDYTQGDHRMRALLGSSLTSWAPISSIKVSTPPWISTASDLVELGFNAMEGDLKEAPERIAKGLYRVGKPYIPGGVLLNSYDTLIRNIGQNKQGVFK